MKKIFLTVIALACLIAGSYQVSAQRQTTITASNNYITRDFNGIPEFSAISLAGSPDVEYRQSSDGTTKVAIYGSDNVIDYLELTVSGGTLNISFRRNLRIKGSHKIKVIASSPRLNAARVAGSGDIVLLGVTETGDFEMHVQGSGDIKCHGLNCSGNSRFSVAGSGDIDVDGHVKCSGSEVHVQGSGDIDIERLTCESARLGVAGSGDLDIGRLECSTLLAVVRGSGDISVKGSAADADYQVSGSGDISAEGLTASNVKANVGGSGGISCHANNSIEASVGGSGSVVYGGDPAHTAISGKKGGVRRR